MKQQYLDETVNGITVKSEISGSVTMKRFAYRITWEDENGNDCGEDGFGYTSLDACEEAMGAAFKRAMENGRIGGKAIKFNGFPIAMSYCADCGSHRDTQDRCLCVNRNPGDACFLESR